MNKQLDKDLNIILFMSIYNKITLLSNLNELNNLLKNNDNPNLYNCKCIYKDRIAIQHYSHENSHTIRIWKTKSLFDYWYNDFHYNHRNFIAALDYTIYDKHIKIDYLYINDSENKVNKKLYDNSLDEYEMEELLNSLIYFIKIIAKNENKQKITKDVHQNLKIYEKYYYYEGFKVTNIRCIDNPFWIETELILP
jgi:hypothetical protein